MSPIEAVDRWLQQVVVGQNFCPFAGKPFAEGRVLIQEILEADVEALLMNALAALESFHADEAIETLLLVLPKGYEDFMDYLDLADTFELLLEEEFGDEFSLATFHPAYQFAEFAPDDVVHHIHRSPFPILHILREDSIAKVRMSMTDTTEITSRNHAHATRLGIAFFEQYQAKN